MEWLEKRAELERQLLDAKKKVMEYDTTLRPYRTITDSEYKQARKDIVNLSTEIYNGNHEAGRPINPLDSMSLVELKDHYAKEKFAYECYLKYGHSPDTGMQTALMKIENKIQSLEPTEEVKEPSDEV